MANEAAFTNVITPAEARSTGLTLAVEILTSTPGPWPIERPGPWPIEAAEGLFKAADDFAEYILFGTGRI